jgi:hypothetical protein
MTKQETTLLTELLARLIRIETRVSKLLIHMGLKADGSGPLPPPPKG